MQHDPDFENLVNAIRPQIKECSVDYVYRQLETKQFILIDVREDHEWQTGHLPSAIHLGRGIIERDIAKLVTDKNTSIVLYCGGGFRSALSAYNLQQMGYTNVLSMDGGVKLWKKLNYSLSQE
jgi:rhodanese-related sulfurtransferase